MTIQPPDSDDLLLSHTHTDPLDERTDNLANKEAAERDEQPTVHDPEATQEHAPKDIMGSSEPVGSTSQPMGVPGRGKYRPVRDGAEPRTARERTGQERAEQQTAQERAEQRTAQGRAEQQRTARERAEQRTARERAEQQRTALERAEQRTARERAEQRTARERAEQQTALERAEQQTALERAEQRTAQGRAEQQRTAQERAEQQTARERAEQQRTAQERAEQRTARERAEQRTARERAEQRTAQERAEQRTARERAEQRTARERAEQQTAQGHAEQRTAQGRAEQRTARERAEQRTARERAEQRTAQGRAEQQTAQGRAEQRTAQGRAEQRTALERAEQRTAQGRAEQRTALERAEQRTAQERAEQRTAQGRAEQRAAQERAEQRTAQERAEQRTAQGRAEQRTARERAEQRTARGRAESQTPDLRWPNTSAQSSAPVTSEFQSFLELSDPSIELNEIDSRWQQAPPEAIPSLPPTPQVLHKPPPLPQTASTQNHQRAIPATLRKFKPGHILNGKYRIEQLLARGGMGCVYVGYQIPLERKVAIKILIPQVFDNEFRRRFLLEASVNARLTHSHIVTVHDYGETHDGDLFMAMEFLEGEPLARVIAREIRLAPPRACRIAMQVARALRAAHRAGVVHRDLKPNNIMLMQDEDDDFAGDFVKVLDFGLVKIFGEQRPDVPVEEIGELTRSGVMLGSPRYMSPEQIRSEAIDPRTDIYSLGILMFHMLAGRPPFIGQGSVEILNQHLKTPSPSLAEVGRADCPMELEVIIQRCLAKSKTERYPSMDDLLGDLRAATRLIAPQENTGSSLMLSEPQLGNQNANLSPRPSSSSSIELKSTSLADILGGQLPETVLYSDSPQPLSLNDTSSVKHHRLNALALGAFFFAAIVLGISLAVVLYNKPQSPPTQPIIELTLTSEPRGSEVWLDGHLLGTTPLRKRVTRSPGKVGAFIFRAPGRKDVLLSSRLDLDVILHAALPIPLPPPAEDPSPLSPPPTPEPEVNKPPEKPRPRPKRPQKARKKTVSQTAPQRERPTTSKSTRRRLLVEAEAQESDIPVVD